METEPWDKRRKYFIAIEFLGWASVIDATQNPELYSRLYPLQNKTINGTAYYRPILALLKQVALRLNSQKLQVSLIEFYLQSHLVA